MPTYVYKFLDTGETLEVQQSFNDATLTEAVHPVTGETMAVKKVFLPVGVTFRGDGFYKTDSRNGSKSGGSSSSSSSSESSSGASSGDSSGSSSTDSGASSSKDTAAASSSNTSSSASSSD